MTSRREFLRALGVATAVTTTVSFSARAAEAPSAPGEICVVTYNLRYASPTGENAWPARRPLMRALLQELKPDIMGTQEGVYGQLRDVAADLPEMDWIGLGRDGGSRGEFMAIFYRRDRFEPLEYDHFWLSDTPLVMGSSTWGNTNRRMLTWVLFRDRQTGRDFYFWNTHLDHALQPAREKGAALILERIRSAAKPGIPLLLVGDFNAVAGENTVYNHLVREGGLTDTWTAAAVRRNEQMNSFNGFETAKADAKRIDWILSRGPVSVRASEVITFARDGRYPSDHFPVAAWLTLQGGRVERVARPQHLAPGDLPSFGNPGVGSIRIAIFGEYCVNQPGYYYLPEGSLVRDAIQTAQGTSPVTVWARPYSGIERDLPDGSADIFWFRGGPRAQVNQSVPLKDGDRLFFRHETY